jgi:hypothetical protein
MIFKGTLRQCVLEMLHLLDSKTYDFLSILHYPRAKYYTVCSDSELQHNETDTSFGDVRIICRMTLREIHTFGSTEQLNLELGEFDNDRPASL